MNKSYKVVFSKARGALMVVNECTKSVQAKGTKTVVATAIALTAMGGAFAQDLTSVHELNGDTVGNEQWTFDSDYPANAYVVPNEKGEASITDSVLENITVTINTNSGGVSAVGLASNGSEGALNTATVTGSTFENIKLTSNDKSGNGAHGSAIATGWTKLTLEASHFVGNSNYTTGLQAQAGAVYASCGEVVAKDTEFKQNLVAAGDMAFGGGAALFGTSADFKNVIFDGNEARALNKKPEATPEEQTYAVGGALYLRGGAWGGGDQITVSVIGSTFTNNIAQADNGEGGAVYVKGDPDASKNITFKAQQNFFSSNEASTRGGALYALDATVISTDDTYQDNKAKLGGAIYVDREDTIGNESSFTLAVTEGKTIENVGNVASEAGGFLYMAEGTKVDVDVAKDASLIIGKVGSAENVDTIAGNGTLTKTGTGVMVVNTSLEDFHGNFKITEGVLSVNAGDYLDAEKTIFGEDATVNVEGGELKFAGVTQTGELKVAGTFTLDKGAVTFDNAFLTVGSIEDGSLTITTNNDFISGSDFGGDSAEIQDNLAGLFARGARARESDILTEISQRFTAEDGNALTEQGVEAFRQATGGSVTAGAFNVAYDAQTQFTDSIIRHQMGEHNGYGVWADVYYTSNEAKTLYGESGYKTDIYGGVFGFDATFSCGATAGVAVTVGTGDTDTVGALKSTLDTDFYGVSLYTSKDFSGFDAKLDVGYMAFDNDFSGLGDAADVDAWTIGLRGDFKAYEGNLVSVTPHVGMRYTHFKADAVAFNDETTLNVFETPVGVAFNGNIEMGGWKVVPAIDFSIVPQLGDKDVDTFAGNVDVIDNLYNTTVGVEALYQNLSVGLDYRYGFGNEERSNNSVNLKVRYRF